ncbi:tryptophan halogenase family protein [Gilvimarinus chinensis]|uniref:tryptophan halogenase family protein n=1 Tax=Gilvimarinus chinensis TaxID=396005 RepID=UPI0004762AA4|nr:tryptophan halogenase family protein [Gilvimarinus chinensis]
MSGQAKQIERMVIVGGGTAGWIAATTLGRIFQNSNVSIELVESEQVGVIGVGEATVPLFVDFLRRSGIDEADFIRRTQATFKWGIEFVDWRQKGESYLHTFGEIGRTIDGHDFYQIWLKARAQGDTTPLLHHAPEAVLAAQNKFYLPFNVAGTPLANARYALHLDATLVSQYLSDYAQGLGVKRTVGHVADVHKTAGGFINSLQLADGRVIEGDFFIDCSGFQGLLIEQHLHAGYENWSEYLPCDRAVTVASARAEVTKVQTVATARSAGWGWRIPLQHRNGNGYVYASQFIDDDIAQRELLEALDTEPLAEPRIIPFTTGIRRKVWDKNCLALGLAQGFLEPLESTAIHLVSKSLAHFVRLFPAADCAERLQREFNRRLYDDYCEIRDFLILHYCTTARSDTPFWQYCQNMPLPDSLAEKLSLFREQGNLQPGVEDFFQPSSWQMVLTGMGVTPRGYNPTVDALDYQALARSLAAGKEAIARAAAKQPSHDEFINTYCRAPVG